YGERLRAPGRPMSGPGTLLRPGLAGAGGHAVLPEQAGRGGRLAGPVQTNRAESAEGPCPRLAGAAGKRVRGVAKHSGSKDRMSGAVAPRRLAALCGGEVMRAMFRVSGGR